MKNASEIAGSLSPEKLALLQRRLQQKQMEKHGPAPISYRITRRRGKEPPPLSFGQERIWFLDQLQPDNPAYNVPVTVPLSGSVVHAGLEWSINAIVARHEALRTTFTVKEGRPVQSIAERTEITIPVIQFTGAEKDRGNLEVAAWMAEEMSRPFVLSRGPLLRASLLQIGLPGGEPTQLLFIVLHHIIFDAWSTRLLLNELREHYNSYSRGNPAVAVPELPIQYADFAVWQREWLQGERLDNLLSYWLKQLSGAPALLELPTDRPRPLMKTSRGSQYAFGISSVSSEGLKSLSQRMRTTLFMTYLAAFAVLLRRYTHKDDLPIGTPIANRGRSELEGLIGFFLNTLVLRLDLSGDPSFSELLARVRETTLQAFAHQDLPFEKLVEAIQPDRNMSVNPLVQVMFVFQSTDAEAAPLQEGLGNAPQDSETSAAARFDVTLSLMDQAGRVSGNIEYNTDLFDASTIQRLAGHFQTLLESISRNPDLKLSALPMLTDAERAQLAEWNSTQRVLPSCRTIHELVERCAETVPESPALIFEGRHLTYKALNSSANQVARHLLRLGTQADERVGIFIDRSPEMIIGLLGILKAGAAYVPLDPAYPRDSLAYMLSDSGATRVLTQDRLASSLPDSVQPICLDTDWGRIRKENPENLGLEIDSLQQAYVIYTSGSTGRPKGVVVPHLGAVNCAEVEARMFGIRRQDRVLQFATLNFDASLYDMIMCWWDGACLCLARRESIIPGPELVQLLNWKQITVLPIPPSALAVLPAEKPSALRLITVMGEACPQELVARWKSVPGFFNAYGPTETTMWVAGGYLSADRKPTIGRPTANSRIHLLDKNMREVPVGVTGEIYIGGVGVTQGYINRPGLTAECFVPDLFADQPGARLYKTGDLARYLPNGEIDFIGREDSQIKIRGYRVELGEIETLLNSHPHVRDALVIVRDDLATGKGIVAYLVKDPDSKLDTAELRRFLEQRLPRHMLPAAFVQLDSIPLTASGKADRQALVRPEAARAERQPLAPALEGTVEARMARIWAEVLGVDAVGVDENFFELGGHSLLATQIVTRVRDTFGIELPMRHLFETPTVSGLSAVVQELGGDWAISVDTANPPVAVVTPSGNISRAADSIDRQIAQLIGVLDPQQKQALLSYLMRETAPREQTFPASYGQERMWFLDRLEPGNPVYNLPTALPLAGPVDVEALQRSVDEVVRRHESLRTTFRMENGRLLQVVAPTLHVELRQVALEENGDEKRAQEYARIAARESFGSFDLEKGPLFSAVLVRQSAHQETLFLTTHHIISDGWSTGILCRELMILYATFITRRPSPLPELQAQYSSFVRWQRERMQGKFFDESLAFWREKLRGAPAVLELPLDRPRHLLQTYRGALEMFQVPDGTARELAIIAQSQDASLFMTLLAAFNIFLTRYIGSGDVVIGTPITNRPRSEFEGVIGLFVNTMVVRFQASQGATFRETLRKLRDEILEAYTYVDLPFEKLVEDLQPERSLSINPLFQVMFSFHNLPSGTQDSPPAEMSTQTANMATTAKFDLSLHIFQTKQGFLGAFEYKTDLFDRSTVARMASSFRMLLEGIVADAGRKISEIAILPETDRHLLARQNDTVAAYDLETTLHGRIERQAQLTPDATAVISEGGQITYAQLDARANQVAHALIAAGARPETRVAICVERSIEMVAGLLGILKAGAAYVPLDAAYPRERLAFMLRDSGVAIVLAKGSLAGELPVEATTLVRFDDERDSIGAQSRAVPRCQVTADHLAYLIYTSGSTGQPKAVMINHRAIVNRLLWMQEKYPLTSDDRVLQKTPLGFDVSVWEVFWPLMCGASLVMARPDAQRDSGYLTRVIRERRITHVHFVPSMLHMFLQEPGVDHDCGLRRVICSGEELPASLKARFLERLDAELHNLYGPTEAAVDVSFWACTRDDRRATVPIGFPISNIQLHILDSNMKQTPIGVAGELYIGGVGLARGYHDRPGLSAERFVPDPFASRPGQRLYRTGDRARYLSDGAIEFLGRLDRQLKIRGIRVELGEIEAVLARHASVDAVAVSAYEAQNNGTRSPVLVAYVVPRGGSAPAPEDLRNWLSGQLPQHMIPVYYEFVDRMPLSANGKVDLKALPKPQLQPVGQSRYEAPRNPVEEAIAAIWSEVLGIEKIGIRDNFFQLGGHSLLVLQVLSRMRDILDVDWPLTGLFSSPTIAKLAADLLRDAERAARIEKRALLLKRINTLSDRQVEALLVEGQGEHE